MAKDEEIKEIQDENKKLLEEIEKLKAMMKEKKEISTESNNDLIKEFKIEFEKVMEEDVKPKVNLLYQQNKECIKSKYEAVNEIEHMKKVLSSTKAGQAQLEKINKKVKVKNPDSITKQEEEEKEIEKNYNEIKKILFESV